MLWAHLELTLTRSFYGHVLQWPLHLGPTYANLRQPTPGVLYGMCLSKPLDSINVTTALSLCTFSITYHHNYCKHLSCGLDMIAMLWLLQWVAVVAGLVWTGAGMHWQCCMVCLLPTRWLLCQVKQDGYTAFVFACVVTSSAVYGLSVPIEVQNAYTIFHVR